MQMTVGKLSWEDMSRNYRGGLSGQTLLENYLSKHLDKTIMEHYLRKLSWEICLDTLWGKYLGNVSWKAL